MWFGFADRDSAPMGDELPAGVPSEGSDAACSDAGDLMMTLLPWGVSFLLHAGLVLLAVFLVWTTADTTSGEDNEVIIPIARLSATPGAPLSMVSAPTALADASTGERPVATPAVAPTVSSLARRTSSGAGGGLGTGAGTSGGTGAGEGAGAAGWGGTGFGSGGGTGGPGGGGSPFGSGVGGGAGGPKASFYGTTGGNAYKVIYLIDASGSLIDTLPFVILELKRAISDLSEKQSFTVIFFQGDEPLEVPVPNLGLKPATAQNKAKVIEWIDAPSGNVVPMGGTNPVKALQLALKYKPQLLFILSDNITGQGKYEVDQRKLLAEVQRVNTGGTKINTIQFLYQDPLKEKGMKATLELIADNSGGMYKFLDGRELQIE